MATAVNGLLRLEDYTPEREEVDLEERLYTCLMHHLPTDCAVKVVIPFDVIERGNARMYVREQLAEFWKEDT